MLSHAKGAIRLARLQNRGAVLMDHNTRDQIGVVESVELGTDRVARAVVRFGKSERAEEIFQDVQDGIRAHVSVGYMVHSWKVEEGKGDAPSTYTALDWEPLEISIVSVPADPTVGIGRGLTDEQAQHLSREYGIALKAQPAADPVPEPETKPTEVKLMEKPAEQIAAEARAAAQADAAKATTAIINLGRAYAHLGGERHAADFLQSGKTDAAEFQAVLLSKIGTAGSDAKCQLALANGAEFCINYSTEDFQAKVKEITGGKGVKVVYDSVGKDTWDKSLDCLAPFGLMASFGNASGAVAPFAPGILGPKGSIYVTRQTLFSHITTRENTQEMADDLFEAVTSGKVKIHIDQTFPLAKIQDAHIALEARKTTGCTIITL